MEISARIQNSSKQRCENPQTSKKLIIYFILLHTRIIVAKIYLAFHSLYPLYDTSFNPHNNPIMLVYNTSIY